MKRFITLITLLFVAVCLFSQRTADRFMTLGCSISQSGASSGKPHVSCNCVDQGGTYDASNVQVGDSLMFVDGGVGYKVPIDSIVTPGTPTVVVRVDWTGLGLVMIPTGSGAISRAATNGIDVDVAGLSDGDAQVFKEDNVANLDFNNNRTYVTSDSFSTFVPSTPVPQEGDLALRLLTGNLYQKISGNWVRKSLENGTTTASIYSAGSVDTLTWNGNLYRHVRVNAGTRDTVHIDFPTNMATQFVGSTYLIGVQNSTNVLTVTWDTLYGTFDLTDMPPQTVGVNNTINYEFRVVSGGSEGVRLQWVDGGTVGEGVTDGDKGDIDVTDSGATWTIDTSAVEWVNLSFDVQDSISCISNVINQPSHGFSVGDPVFWLSGILSASSINALNPAQAVVIDSVNANTVVIATAGTCDATSHGFTVDSSYYTPRIAGSPVINTNRPDTIQYLFKPKSTAELVINIGEMFVESSDTPSNGMQAVQSISSTGSPTVTTGFTIIPIQASSASGSVDVQIDPATTGVNYRIVATDVTNTLRVVPTAGTISGMANYTFSVASESISVISDGTNLYLW